MAAFQIHEDVENLNSKIHLKKLKNEKHGVKKKFGENNENAVQALANSFKNADKSRIPRLKHVGSLKEQAKKPKIVIESDKIEVSSHL